MGGRGEGGKGGWGDGGGKRESRLYYPRNDYTSIQVVRPSISEYH